MEQRGRALASVEPAFVHLTDVGDEVGFDAPRLPQEIGEAAEELVIGNGLKFSVRAIMLHL